MHCRRQGTSLRACGVPLIGGWIVRSVMMALLPVFTGAETPWRHARPAGCGPHAGHTARRFPGLYVASYWASRLMIPMAMNAPVRPAGIVSNWATAPQPLTRPV